MKKINTLRNSKVYTFQDLQIKSPIDQLKMNVKILVIDDDEIFPVAGFKEFGYNIQQWKKVDENGLRRLRNGEFEIIVLDIYGVATEIATNDGMDVLEDLKNHNPSQVVVAYSGQAFQLSKSKFWELADEKLSKPTPFISTQKTIDGLIESSFNIDKQVEKLKAILKENNVYTDFEKVEKLFFEYKEKGGEPNWWEVVSFLNVKNGDKQKVLSILRWLYSYSIIKSR